MMRGEPSRRIAYIHAGTHKTGTTSIQALLGQNDALLARAGIHIPQTARITPRSAGHHNVAWELNNPHQFDPHGGTLAELFAEIERADRPTVCVSSEECEFLSADSAKLITLADGFRRLGYEPHAILYLRPQADYLESLYAEIAKRWTVDFRTFLKSIAERGIYGESCFDYDQLVGGFEDVFGAQRVHVRAYRRGSPTRRLLLEFLSILCSGGRHALDVEALHWPERKNQMLAYDELIAVRRAMLEANDVTAPPNGIRAGGERAAFAPLTLAEITSLAVRFWPANDRVARRHGIELGSASWHLVVREVMTVLTANEDGRRRKRRSRSLDLAASEARGSA